MKIELSNGKQLKVTNEEALINELVSYIYMVKDSEEADDFMKECNGVDKHHFLTKKEIIDKLLLDCDETIQEVKEEIHHTVNSEVWTIADLFIRQHLNNNSDGFGLKNVRSNYEYLVEIKQKLIDFNLVSEEGRNNSGFSLWKNYNY